MLAAISHGTYVKGQLYFEQALTLTVVARFEIMQICFVFLTNNTKGLQCKIKSHENLPGKNYLIGPPM